MKTLIFSILFLSSIVCYSQTIKFESDSLRKPVLTKQVYEDIQIRDPKTGKLLAFKEHGKEWILYDPKKAVEVLVNELEKNNITIGSQFPRFIY